MRRRRRARVQWFPPLGTAIGQEIDKFVGGTTFEIPVFGNTDTQAFFLPLTFDEGQENKLAEVDVSLADLMGSAWRLRRMIIDVFATYRLTGLGTGDPVSGQPPGTVFSVGCMVLAVDASGSPAQVPSPLERQNNTDPWIWRRIWVLGQGQRMLREGAGLASFTGFRPSAGAVTDQDAAFANFPVSNTEYGYLAGGPHIDQKTNRVVGPEERLFLIFATKALALNTIHAIDATVVGYLDYRLLGTLQRATNRRNASR